MLLRDRLDGYHLILASQSPRRRDLLEGCGLEFTVADRFECVEEFADDMPKEAVAEYLSQLKSEAYPKVLGVNDILLTADTVVLAGGEILGKPKDEADARRMLGVLSGGEHKVITGVTLRNALSSRSFSVESRVYFRELSDEEIDYYVKFYHPMDKAGAYGIQEWIGYVAIERIEGSFYNVMGLPVQRLYCELERFLEQG